MFEIHEAIEGVSMKNSLKIKQASSLINSRQLND